MDKEMLYKTMRLKFGKYKGQLVNKVPPEYLIWCYKNIKDFIRDKQPEFYEYLEYLWYEYLEELDSLFLESAFPEAVERRYGDSN